MDLIKVDAFYSTLFCLANTTRIYMENNLFLYAVKSSGIRFKRKRGICRMRRVKSGGTGDDDFRKVRDLRIGIRLLTCLTCRFRPISP